MTAPAVAVASPGRARPVAWSRLGWVTWRRHRATVVATLAVLAAIGVYLLVTGLRMRSAWSTVRSCTPQHSSACEFALGQFNAQYGNLGILGVVFIFTPLLIGSFAGAPLLGRELETGTFRYAWTQGAGRTRWALALLVPGAVGVGVLCAAFGLLVAWQETPLWQTDNPPRLSAVEFASTGIAVVGWGLAAYAVGVVAGLVWRRVVPALASTVVVMFLLALTASKTRMHYLPPLKRSGLRQPFGSQTLQQWWEKGGVHVSPAQLNAALRAAGLQEVHVGGGKTSVQASPQTGGTDPMTYLLHHGYAMWTSYQPASRYWTLQWIELGWLLALSVVLLTTAVVLVRRRDA
jgi:hypothetical protein